MEWKVATNRMKTKMSPSMTLKLNLSKTYDRVECRIYKQLC